MYTFIPTMYEHDECEIFLLFLPSFQKHHFFANKLQVSVNVIK